MKKNKLEQLKQRLSRDSDKTKDSQPDDDNPKTDDVDEERASILQQGKSYIKPLGINPRKAVKISGIIVGVLIVAIVAVFAVLIYRFESDSDIVYGASKIIPFPAARVDGSFVGYDDYLFELRTLKASSASQLNGGEGVDFTTEEGQQQLDTLKSLAMTEAQRKLIVGDMAEEKGVEVTEEEVDEEINHFIEQEGGEEQLEKAIDEFFGWSLRDFRRVIHVQMLEQKLAESRAEEVLARVEEGEDFAELAREYSSDGSATEGGDLGYVDEDTQFVEEFKTAAMELEPGETTGLVETQFGYHIIKSTEENEDGNNRISHILIDRASVQREIQQRLEDATVSIYTGADTEALNQQNQQPEGGQENGEGEGEGS